MIFITGQVPEEFLYNGEVYSLTGVNGIGLFNPEEFGIIPQTASTACWRGFQMGYKIENNVVFLDWMAVRTDLSPPPLIDNVNPKEITGRKPGEARFSHRYENLNLKSHFTGKLLIGKDFLRAMYVHMGFQKPITYKTVLEIFIEDGSITEIKDRSKDVEVIRKKAQEFDPEKESVQDFIQGSFSLDYDL